MSKPQRFQGEFVDQEQPDWRPILALVGPDLTGNFMWMGELVLSDGTHVHAYKHHHTRRYLHLGVDGRAFYYDWNRPTPPKYPVDYVEMPRTRAIDAVFRGWKRALRPEDVEEIWGLVQAAWDVAAADGTYEIDPRELELQREFEAKQDEAEAA